MELLEYLSPTHFCLQLTDGWTYITRDNQNLRRILYSNEPISSYLQYQTDPSMPKEYFAKFGLFRISLKSSRPISILADRRMFIIQSDQNLTKYILFGLLDILQIKSQRFLWWTEWNILANLNSLEYLPQSPILVFADGWIYT